MIPPFDIFRLDKDPLGTAPVLWIAAASTLEEARSRVEEVGKLQPGRYVIRSIQTGHHEYITVDGKRWAAGR